MLPLVRHRFTQKVQGKTSSLLKMAFAGVVLFADGKDIDSSASGDDGANLRHVLRQDKSARYVEQLVACGPEEPEIVIKLGRIAAIDVRRQLHHDLRPELTEGATASCEDLMLIAVNVELDEIDRRQAA